MQILLEVFGFFFSFLLLLLPSLSFLVPPATSVSLDFLVFLSVVFYQDPLVLLSLHNIQYFQFLPCFLAIVLDFLLLMILQYRFVTTTSQGVH